jgi:hypothetical protein
LTGLRPRWPIFLSLMDSDTIVSLAAFLTAEDILSFRTCSNSFTLDLQSQSDDIVQAVHEARCREDYDEQYFVDSD